MAGNTDGQTTPPCAAAKGERQVRGPASFSRAAVAIKASGISSPILRPGLQHDVETRAAARV
eukprot:6798988-Prymnesium_polylepis.2